MTQVLPALPTGPVASGVLPASQHARLTRFAQPHRQQPVGSTAHQGNRVVYLPRPLGSMSAIVFEDIFDVKDVDPQGKKFVR